MRAGPLLAAAALAALAVVAGLLAHAAGAWDERLSDDDARFLAGERVAWTVDTPLAGVAERLVGLGDDLDARRAIALHRRAEAGGADLGSGQERQGVRSAAEAALADVAQGTDGSRSAQASVLLGTLLFEDAGTPDGPTPGGACARRVRERARGRARQRRGRVRPRAAAPAAGGAGRAAGHEPGAGARGGGRRGAGGGTPGRGY